MCYILEVILILFICIVKLKIYDNVKTLKIENLSSPYITQDVNS